MDARTLWKIVNFYARFTPTYTKIGYGFRRLGWTPIPPGSFAGQRWLVTGASSGLGKAMMHFAALDGAHVVAVSSNESKLNAAVGELPQEAGSRVSVVAGDLSLVSGTRRLLEKLLASGEKYDVIQNNAGMLFTELSVTDEGREATFVINVLSHYLLTKGLVEEDALNSGSVIVNMTSGGMYNAPLGIAGLNTTDASKYNGKASYAYAKRAQVALTDYWNDQYGGRGISSYVTHPGWARTPGVKEALPVFSIIQAPILRTPRQGADTALWLTATRPPIQQDVVWFDRKARQTHMYEYTKKPQCTIQELVDYLDEEIAKT